MKDRKQFRFEGDYKVPTLSVWVEVDLEKCHIKTNARYGPALRYALRELWLTNEELYKHPFPMENTRWTYEFVNGFLFGEIV